MSRYTHGYGEMYDFFTVKFSKVSGLDNEPILPRYAHVGDSGMDLFSVEDVCITPNERKIIRTGWYIELPFGYEGQVRSRSGLAYKRGLTVLNSPGTIDSCYRGELKVILINGSLDYIMIKPGDAIAQLVVAPVRQFKVIEVDHSKFTDTERGKNGFGSTDER